MSACPLGVFLLLIPHGRQVIDGLRFTSAGQFVNFARIHPKLLAKGSPIHWAGRNSLAIGVSVLTVQDSFLRTPGLFGSSTTLKVYKLTGFPFPQEWRRESSLLPALLGFSDGNVIGPISQNGVSYNTKMPSKFVSHNNGQSLVLREPPFI